MATSASPGRGLEIIPGIFLICCLNADLLLCCVSDRFYFLQVNENFKPPTDSLDSFFSTDTTLVYTGDQSLIFLWEIFHVSICSIFRRFRAA